ncbi:MAG: hypothetical protein J7L89_09930, partial [Bacteroidales bacterium]|nr:hypothetical protein [Bacteroidales bacterium]
IRNWKSRDIKADLKINGISVKPGPDFRQGVNIDTDGTFTLIVWVGLKADTPQRFEITEHNTDR